MKINVNPDIINDVYRPFLDWSAKIEIFYGSGSSGKSFFVLGQRTVFDLLRGGRNFIICRQVGRTNRDSTFKEITKGINSMGPRIAELFAINRSELTITCKHNGYQCLFRGLDDVEKIKSTTSQVGVITDIIVEEATEANLETVKQLFVRMRGEAVYCGKKINKRMTFLLNPVALSHWIATEFFANWIQSPTLQIEDILHQHRALLELDENEEACNYANLCIDEYNKQLLEIEPDYTQCIEDFAKCMQLLNMIEFQIQGDGYTSRVRLIRYTRHGVLQPWELETVQYNGTYEGSTVSIRKTTYMDNLDHLADDDIQFLENQSDEYFYWVYSRGNWGIIGKLIYKNNWRVEPCYHLIDNYDIFGGLDFGYVHPLACVMCAYDDKTDTLYIFDEVYQSGLKLSEAAKLIINMLGSAIVYCDTAEPRSITSMSDYGVNAVPTRKGPGSVQEGINFLRARTIVIDPRCVNTKNEIEQYHNKKNPSTGVYDEAPAKVLDDAMDATRYSIMHLITGKIKPSKVRHG